MSRPIIQKILPFDGDQQQDIFLSWTGNRAYTSEIIIYDNTTNTEFYRNTSPPYELKHTIPAGTLPNGKIWNIQARVYDKEELPSPLSEKVLFYTFQRPVFAFHSIPDSHIITSASFTASIAYDSPDWENISSYVFYLYDASKRLRRQSDTMHDIFNIQYDYRGLDNNTDYYIRCTAVTVHGMLLDTDYVKISVKFEDPNTYARLYTRVHPDQGCVQAASNLIMIRYNGTEDFTYENSMIDLVGKTLYYDEGFLIENDFTMIIKGKNLWQNAEILKMKNADLGLTLSSHIYTDGKLRFKLLVPNGVCHYLLYSDEQVFGMDDMVTIVLRRKDDLYQIKVFVENRR